MADASTCSLGLGRTDVVIAVLAYVTSSLGAVGVVKCLNYHFCFSEPWFLAMACRSTFLLSLPLHLFLTWRNNVIRPGFSTKRVFIYVTVGLALSAVEACNMLSMIMLPGSWYAMIKGSDVGFSLVLSRVLLKKNFPPLQNAAAVLLFLGVTVGAVFGVPVSSEHMDATREASKETHLSQEAAAWLSLFGTFLSALVTVLTDGFLKKRLKEEERSLLASTNIASVTNSANDRGSEASMQLLMSNAYSMNTTFVSFIVLGLPFGLSDEASRLQLASVPSCQKNAGAPTSWSSSQVTFLTLIALVGLTRFAERILKYYMTLRESAFFFSVVQSFRRLIGVFVLAFCLGESLSTATCVGAGICMIGFILYLRGGSSKRKASTAIVSLNGGQPTAAGVSLATLDSLPATSCTPDAAK
eukprot:gnl/TRDRNA2_/TRDRNA2_32535_c0_seq1.p1 gnl/TRDRNA2_/TRDRNA2_32535_c0~~gnl/TRDRNA2_/TRDRNA2_32535_c0_seq1.p1  ORF type:complete len:413 (+),score=52.82 gnl/TRDRNA2_/TRDRNA2_32535_c0_seq1:118-1356(+)